jgi:hypothetical protein
MAELVERHETRWSARMHTDLSAIFLRPSRRSRRPGSAAASSDGIPPAPDLVEVVAEGENDVCGHDRSDEM